MCFTNGSIISHILKFILKKLVLNFRNKKENQSVKLIREGQNKKAGSINCRFSLNLGSTTNDQFNFLRILENKNEFYLFLIFGSVNYLLNLVEVHANLHVCVAYPLNHRDSNTKIGSLMGLTEVDWENVESGLTIKFDRYANLLI